MNVNFHIADMRHEPRKQDDVMACTECLMQDKNTLTPGVIITVPGKSETVTITLLSDEKSWVN
jgi:hypothetical protein